KRKTSAGENPADGVNREYAVRHSENYSRPESRLRNADRCKNPAAAQLGKFHPATCSRCRDFGWRRRARCRCEWEIRTANLKRQCGYDHQFDAVYELHVAGAARL